MAEATDCLLNALQIYHEVNESSDRLRLVAIDAGQALRELAIREVGVPSPKPSKENRISVYLAKLLNEKIIDLQLKQKLQRNDDRLRNNATHEMEIPDKKGVGLFLNDLRGLFQKLSVLPAEADFVEKFSTRELGFQILCPNTWDIKESNNVVQLQKSDANIWIRLHRMSIADVEKIMNPPDLTVLSRKTGQWQTCKLPGRELEYGYPEDTQQTLRLIDLIEYENRVYEFDYAPRRGLYDRHLTVFRNIVASFKPLGEPLNSHQDTVRVIAEKYFKNSDIIRMRAQRELNTVFIDDLDLEDDMPPPPEKLMEARADLERWRAALERIIHADDPSEQAQFEHVEGSITNNAYDRLVAPVNQCLFEKHPSDHKTVIPDLDDEPVIPEFLHPDLLLYGEDHSKVFLACVVAPASTITLAKILTWRQLAEIQPRLWICAPRAEIDKIPHLKDLTKAEKVYRYFPEGETVAMEETK